ncbi:MAG: carbon starvation protein A [Syntrophomonadaceae bacterium]|jgi:carbon starvation protein|nr:carbon starvation protein A [Syntrophomonadaceae bacterium]
MLTTTTLTLIGMAIWLLGYFIIGGYLQKVYLKYKPGRPVPAIEFRDDVDFYPANPVTLFGDHWASIAGGAPLAGGATGAMWGFLPAFLYITIGNVFLGSPHDYATMHISMRKQGKTIGLLISELISERAGKMGVVLGWFSIAAFTATFLTALGNLFAATPELTLPTIAFTISGVIMGFMIYKGGFPVLWATIVGVVIVSIAIVLGLSYPISLPANVWFGIFVVYPIISASIPAWILVEPRNFLNFVFMVVGALILLTGCIVGNLPLALPAVIANTAKGPVWPMLFITISCGALTGMHSFWTTGYTSRRVPDEKFVRLIGYGGEALEGLTAFVALASAAVLTLATYTETVANGWIFILQSGYATIAGSVFTFIPTEVWAIWGGLLGSIFMITTLESGGRNMRIFMLEFYSMVTKKTISPKSQTSSKWGAATISLLACAALALSGGWFYIWVLFPALSSLLAVMSFMTVIIWLKLVGRPQGYFWFALLFTTFVVAVPGASYLAYTYVVQGMYYLAWIPPLAIAMTIFFYYDFFQRKNSMTDKEIAEATAAEEAA